MALGRGEGDGHTDISFQGQIKAQKPFTDHRHLRRHSGFFRASHRNFTPGIPMWFRPRSKPVRLELSWRSAESGMQPSLVMLQWNSLESDRGKENTANQGLVLTGGMQLSREWQLKPWGDLFTHKIFLLSVSTL